MLTELTKLSLKTKTDKAFWHKYTEVYSEIFKEVNAKTSNQKILEFGVFKGDSIRTYLNYFSNPTISAVDWFPIQESWPIANNVTYHQANQSHREEIAKTLAKINQNFDLVIEDGGHRPDQQYYSLIETIKYLRPGSIYILEDLHTSLKGHPLNSYLRLFFEKYPGNCYNVLVAIKHLNELIEIGKIDTAEAHKRLSSGFSKRAIIPEADRLLLFERIKDIYFYKRSELPIFCWYCYSDQFRYDDLKCTCGKGLIGTHDSLTAILRF
jgi:hypothetical protein